MESVEIKEPSIWPWLLIFLGIVTVWSLSGVWVYTVLANWAARGQFGDMFGAVNALFSGLAFAGLIFTIFLQRRELALQREELKLQREEMAKSRDELARQAKVQEQNLLATIAQLKIAALQGEIPALEMISLKFIPEQRHQWAEKIYDIAKNMNEIIAKLESEVGKAQLSPQTDR